MSMIKIDAIRCNQFEVFARALRDGIRRGITIRAHEQKESGNKKLSKSEEDLYLEDTILREILEEIDTYFIFPDMYE